MPLYNPRQSISEYLANPTYLQAYDYKPPLSDFTSVTKPLDDLYGKAQEAAAGIIQPTRVLEKDQAYISEIENAYQNALDKLVDNNTDPYSLIRGTKSLAKSFTQNKTIGIIGNAKLEYDRVTKLREEAEGKLAEGKIQLQDIDAAIEDPVSQYTGGRESGKFDTGATTVVDRINPTEESFKLISKIKSDGLTIGDQTIRLSQDRAGNIIYTNNSGDRLSYSDAVDIFYSYFISNPNYAMQLKNDKKAAIKDGLAYKRGIAPRYTGIANVDIFRVNDTKQLAKIAEDIYGDKLINKNIRQAIEEIQKLDFNSEDPNVQNKIAQFQNNLFNFGYIINKMKPAIEAASYENIEVKRQIRKPNEGFGFGGGAIKNIVSPKYFTEQLPTLAINSKYIKKNNISSELTTNKNNLVDVNNKINEYLKLSNTKGLTPEERLRLGDLKDQKNSISDEIKKLDTFTDNVMTSVRRDVSLQPLLNNLKSFSESKNITEKELILKLNEYDSQTYHVDGAPVERSVLSESAKKLREEFLNNTGINPTDVQKIDKLYRDKLEEFQTRSVELVGTNIPNPVTEQDIRNSIKSHTNRYASIDFETGDKTTLSEIDDFDKIDWDKSQVINQSLTTFDGKAMYNVSVNIDGENRNILVTDTGDMRQNTVHLKVAQNMVNDAINEMNKSIQNSQRTGINYQNDPRYQAYLKQYNTGFSMLYDYGSNAGVNVESILTKTPIGVTVNIGEGDNNIGSFRFGRIKNSNSIIINFNNSGQGSIMDNFIKILRGKGVRVETDGNQLAIPQSASSDFSKLLDRFYNPNKPRF